MKTGIHAKLKWLTQAKSPPVPAIQPEVPRPGWFAPQSADYLLATPLRQSLMKIIWQRTSLSGTLFAELYQTPVARFAELVQQLPASEYHHHSHPGGLLDHTLEVMAFAAKLRQRHLLPAGAAPEDQAREAEAWTAGIIYAALLHDVGKIATDMEVITTGNQHWYPWQGSLSQPYRLRYHKNRNHTLHPVTASLLVTQILSATALNWLAQYRELYEAFLFCLSGHYEHAGILGELVQEADRASVAQFMGANASQALASPQSSLPKQILMALRDLVQTQFTLNNPHSGSDGWLTDNALWLISKTTADRVRAWLLQQGVTGVPDSNSRLYDEMQTHGLIVTTPENKAIWSCNIAASGGWTPGSPLTLLRLAPAQIWPKPEQRPMPFAGTVQPVNDRHVSSEADQKPVTSASGPEEMPADLTLSLFAAPEQDTGMDRSGDKLVSETSATITETEIAVEFFANIPAETPRGIVQQEGCKRKKPLTAHTLSGADFLIWLRESIQTHKIAVNNTLAPVHMVEGKVLLVSPGIFKLCVQSTTGETGGEWKAVQKSFQKLNLHQRNYDGINIFTCEVRGPRKTRRVKGYLLERPEEIFGNSIPEDNPYLSMIM